MGLSLDKCIPQFPSHQPQQQQSLLSDEEERDVEVVEHKTSSVGMKLQKHRQASQTIPTTSPPPNQNSASSSPPSSTPKSGKTESPKQQPSTSTTTTTTTTNNSSVESGTAAAPQPPPKRTTSPTAKPISQTEPDFFSDMKPKYNAPVLVQPSRPSRLTQELETMKSSEAPSYGWDAEDDISAEFEDDQADITVSDEGEKKQRENSRAHKNQEKMKKEPKQKLSAVKVDSTFGDFEDEN